jgi:iron complex outermembrane receptor protein
MRPEFDIPGSISDERQVLYRLNGVYERADGFRDFDQQIERVFLAPIVSIRLVRDINRGKERW